MLAWALQMSEDQTPSGCPVKIKAKEEEVQEALGQMCVICAQVTMERNWMLKKGIRKYSRTRQQASILAFEKHQCTLI